MREEAGLWLFYYLKEIPVLKPCRKWWWLDCSTLEKSRRYHDLNAKILWFYVLVVPPLKYLTTYAHIHHSTSFATYFILKFVSFMLAVFTLLIRHVSFVFNLNRIMPQHKGFSKFMSINVLKFFIVSLNSFLAIWPVESEAFKNYSIISTQRIIVTLLSSFVYFGLSLYMSCVFNGN